MAIFNENMTLNIITDRLLDPSSCFGFTVLSEKMRRELSNESSSADQIRQLLELHVTSVYVTSHVLR